MAAKSAKPPRKSAISDNKYCRNPKLAFAFFLLLADAILVALIIAYVPYTKIDWDAYMSQVSGFLGGERDYSNLQGDTGPLVYPAGFLYIYSAIQFVTGGEVYPAQILFGVLYIINLGIVLFIYAKTDTLPFWSFCLLSLSKRVHSIFMLRLFNDCVAMTLLHAALALVLLRRWNLGLIIFSFAVSIKMNILLYAPPLLLLMLKAMDIGGVITALAGAALVQILLALPFIVSHPFAYISRAFNLGRVFIHFWSVNFKFVPEPIFVSKQFAVLLLITHLILLAVFAHYKWCKHEGGLFNFIHSQFLSIKLRLASVSFFPKQISKNNKPSFKLLKEEHVVTTMFVGNFIGVLCARSLHYQFYSWYFFSIPYLLWRTPFPTILRYLAEKLILLVWINLGTYNTIYHSCRLFLFCFCSLLLFAGIEFCWNVYPSNMYSSILLLSLHLILLWGLWSGPAEYPYVHSKASDRKQK